MGKQLSVIESSQIEWVPVDSLQALGEKTKPLISSFIECAGTIIFALFIIPALVNWGVIICEPLIWCFMTAQLVYCYLHVPYLRKENA